MYWRKENERPALGYVVSRYFPTTCAVRHNRTGMPDFFFFLPGTTDWSENSSQFWSLPCNELPTNHTLLYITPATAIFLELCQAIRETGIDISLKIAAHFRSLFPHLFIMITIHYTVRSPWGNLKQSGATPGVVVGCHAFAETTWKVWNIHKHFQRVFQKGSTVTREAMYV